MRQLTAPRALITGLTGQDGSFMAELLLDKRYEVHGTVRGGPDDPLGCSEHLRGRIGLVHADLDDPETLEAAVAETRPDELYHFGGPSFVPHSWERPAQTVRAIAAATATLLEAVRRHSPGTRVFVAGSGAMFGEAPESPQNEATPCRPQTPYATAKLAGHQLTGQMREHHGIYACSGILYNHESERRPLPFVTRKISLAAAEIKLAKTDHVVLGDVESVRDWCFAGDVVRGAWAALQQPEPDDYVLASGVPHTVAELARVAFDHVGLEAAAHIRRDPGLVRRDEGTAPVGDPTRARERLGWKQELSFEQLVHRMVDSDLQQLQAVAAAR